MVTLVEKMILETKIEIVIIIVFLILSIPVWQFLSNEFHNNLTTALNNENNWELKSQIKLISE